MSKHPTLLSSSNSFRWSIVVTYDDQVTNVAMRVIIYYKLRKKDTMKIAKDLIKLMKKNDFALHRDKKHLIWKHTGCGVIIVTPKTPSCSRTLKNTKSTIKKKVGYVN